MQTLPNKTPKTPKLIIGTYKLNHHCHLHGHLMERWYKIRRDGSRMRRMIPLALCPVKSINKGCLASDVEEIL